MRSLMLPVRGFCLATVVFAAGCPVDPASVQPGAPELDVGEACRTVNNIRVTGTKPAGTKIVGAVTDPAGATTEVDLTEIDDATEVNASVAVDADGVFTLAFVAENGGGARSGAIGPFAVQVDRTPPAAPSCEAPAPVELPGGAAASVDVTCAIDDADVVTLGVDGTDAAFAGAGTITVAVAEGTNEHDVVAVDACGNRSSPFTFETRGANDLTAPVGLTVVGPAEATLDGSGDTVDVAFSGSKEAGAGVFVRLCPGPCTDEPTLELVAADADDVAADWAGTVALPLGAWALSFTSKDAAGNESAPVAHPIVVRGFVPVPALTSPLPGDTNAASLALAGTRRSGTQVHARIDGVDEPVLLDDGASDAGTWAGTLDISGFADVPVSPFVLTFTLFASDNSTGDVSADSAPFVVRIDRTPPEAPVLDPTPPVLRLEPGQASGAFAFSGTGEPGATLVSAAVSRGLVADDASFAFELTLTAADTSIVLTQRDAAGNESPAATATFAVEPGLFKPVLLSPRTQDFPVITRDATVALAGTRRANCGTGGPCGIEAVNAVDGTATVVAVVDGSTSWSGTLPLVEGNNRFFLRTFDARTPRSESASLTLPGGAPFLVVKDTTPPAPPVPNPPSGLQGSETTFTVDKGEADGLLIRVNGEPAERLVAPVLDGQATVTVTEPVKAGDNLFCFVTIDRAGNRSDDGDGEPVCITIASAPPPTVTLLSPAEGDLIAGDSVRVEAVVEGVATSFEVCLGADCSGFAPDAQTGGLSTDVDVGAAPADGAFLDVTVCALRDAIRACTTVQVLRWTAPFQVSPSESPDAFTPAVAVDSRGFVHVIWEDSNKDVDNDCVAPRLDVITRAARNGAGQLVLTTTRGGGFAIGDRVRVVGAAGFDGDYTIAAVNAVDRTVATRETVPSNLPVQTRGNVLGLQPAAICAGPDILYRRLDDNGWSDIVNVSDLGLKASGVPLDGVSQRPTIAVDADDDVHIVWEESGDLDGDALEAGGLGGQRPDLVHRVMSGFDGTFGVADVITNDTGVQSHGTPALAADGGDVLIVWQERTNDVFGSGGNIRLSRFAQGAWSPPAFVASGTGFTPAVVVDDDGTALVAWSDNADGDRDVVLCRMLRGDAVCANARKVVVSDGPDSGDSTVPSLALATDNDGDSVDLVWLDSGNGTDTALLDDEAVFHRRYRFVSPVGPTTSPVTRLSDDGDIILSGPAVAAATDGRVVAAWPSFNLVGAAFNVARATGAGIDTTGDGVFDDVDFGRPALLVGPPSGTPDADALDVRVVVDGVRAFYAFASDPDLFADPGYDAVVHAETLP